MDEWQARMENKIDRLSDAVVQLARMEERMITLFNRMDKYENNHTKLEDRVDDLEDTSTKRGTVFEQFGKGFWIVVTAAVSSAFWWFNNG